MKEVKMVGVVLEIDGEEHVLGKEQAESVYRALDRMFNQSNAEAERVDEDAQYRARMAMERELMLERQRQAAMQNNKWGGFGGGPVFAMGDSTSTVPYGTAVIAPPETESAIDKIKRTLLGE